MQITLNKIIDNVKEQLMNFRSFKY